MQHVWRISKNILFSELPPYHPFPLHSSLPERERGEKTPLSSHSQMGECIQTHTNPSPSRTAHKHFDNTHIHTHTHKQQSWVTLGDSKKALGEWSLLQQLTAQWETQGEWEDSHVTDISGITLNISGLGLLLNTTRSIRQTSAVSTSVYITTLNWRSVERVSERKAGSKGLSSQPAWWQTVYRLISPVLSRKRIIEAIFLSLLKWWWWRSINIPPPPILNP